MKKTLRLLLIITVISLFASACAAGPKGQNGSAAVDTVTAKTMRLIRAEGSIELTDESGASLPLEEGMRLFSGTSVETQAKSKAGISLDDVKAATVGVESLAALFQESRLLRLNLIRGELYFSVAKPLEKDEEFYIETSNMTMGIRGTSGYVSTVSAKECVVILTSGHAEIRAGDTVQPIDAGQCVRITITEDGKAQFDVFEISPEAYPALLIEELAADERMLDEVAAQNADVSKDQMKAMDVYGQILADPSSYWTPSYWTDAVPNHYQYALVTLNEYAPVPTLFLAGETEANRYYIRFFQYDPATGSFHSPDGVRNADSTYVLTSGEGILFYSDGTTGNGGAFANRITINGDTVGEEMLWTGHNIGDALPAELAHEAISWKELSEFGAQVKAPLPTDGNRIVFAGTIHYYTTQELLNVEGITNPNAVSAYLQQYPDRIFCIIELEEPQTMNIRSLVWPENAASPSIELAPKFVERIGLESLIDGYIYDVNFIESFRQYEGERHIFSIDPNKTGNLRQDVHLPNAPLTDDVHVLQ